MARSARQQRRQRRARLEPVAAGAGTPPPPQPQPVREGGDEPERRRETGRAEPKQRFRFIRESWAELKKVDWPNRNQVTQGTVVVIIACAIVGTYLWLADLVFQPLVERLLLGQ